MSERIYVLKSKQVPQKPEKGGQRKAGLPLPDQVLALIIAKPVRRSVKASVC